MSHVRFMLFQIRIDVDQNKRRTDVKDLMSDVKEKHNNHKAAHGHLLDRVIDMDNELRKMRRKMRHLQNATTESTSMNSTMR